MGSTDGFAGHPPVLAAATERRLSSDGHQDSQQSSFGALGMESQRHDGIRAIPWTRKWGIVAILMSLGFLAIILVALAVSRDADGRPLADITRVHRVAFASCTQRHVGENQIWTKVSHQLTNCTRPSDCEYSSLQPTLTPGLTVLATCK